MKVSDYIKSKFQSFGIQLSEAEILDLSLNESFSLEDEVTITNTDAVNIAIAGLIPSVLARPDVSESGFSMKVNIEGIKSYYSFLCRTYGIEATSLSTISDASNSW